MDRVTPLLRSVAHALCEKGRRALAREIPFGDVLLDVAKLGLDDAHRSLPGDDLKLALVDVATADPAAFAEAIARALEKLGRGPNSPFRAELEGYLGGLPTAARQVLRRPSDPTGTVPPPNLRLYRPEDLLLFLPPRLPRFRPAGEPTGLDGWELADLAGLSEIAEVWVGTDDARPQQSPAALKFATDPTAAAQVAGAADVFLRVFDLTDEPGIVPLRTVYLDTDPPCLESAYVEGYDLTSLIYDWKWRYDAAKPAAALKLVHRLAEVVGKAHAKGLVHRDLKPSNVLLYPTDGGKFTVWITDFGWGQIQAARSVELGAHGTPRAEQVRLGRKGAYTPLYAALQIARKEAPDPRDDVHALGVIWYQLLCRDPNEGAPVGAAWAGPYHAAGLTDAQARLLNACVSPRADKRPADALVLAEELAKLAAEVPRPAPSADPPTDGSRLLSVKGHSSVSTAPPNTRSNVVPIGEIVRRPAGGGDPPSSVVRIGKPDRADVEFGFGGLATRVKNSLGMTFALVPPGRFRMGSAPGEPGRRDHEGPAHEVTLTRPVYLAVTAVTQAEYEAVTGQNPSQFTKAHGGGPQHPVERVTWADADEFCRRLSAEPAERAAGRRYRLPTEAEWEFGCRAGTTSPFHTGDALSPKEAHFLAPGAFGKHGGQGRTCPVARFPANPLGLHDAHGNVYEWVADWYGEGYYRTAPPADPAGPAAGAQKVVRGGCFAALPADCRSAARRPQNPAVPSNTIGFRVVLQVGPKG